MRNNAAMKRKQVPEGYLVVGVDPHKKRHAAVAITQDFTTRDKFKFDNTREGLETMLRRARIEMAKAFPDYSDWIEQVCGRLVDLLAPFRNFDYYHPAQKGSASLKAVLPAITGRGYEDLDISDGQVASVTFLAATYGDMPEAERAQVVENLEKYCGRDTEGMIWIIDKLTGLCD